MQVVQFLTNDLVAGNNSNLPLIYDCFRICFAAAVSTDTDLLQHMRETSQWLKDVPEVRPQPACFRVARRPHRHPPVLVICSRSKVCTHQSACAGVCALRPRSPVQIDALPATAVTMQLTLRAPGAGGPGGLSP